MGSRVPLDVLADEAEKLARVGVSEVEFDEDGYPKVLRFHPHVRISPSDTIPCPPPPPPSSSGILPIADPHPDLIAEDEPASEAIGRELEALARMLPRAR